MQTNENKVALVSGANTGVGFQIAKALTENGYKVYAGSRNLQKGEAAVEKLGEKAQAIQLDITDPESIRKAVQTIENEHGYLTLLVNNAAVSHAGASGRTMEEVLGSQRASIASIDELKTVWDTNVFGTLALTQAFLPLLKQAPSARIVTVSSALGSLTINANPENPYRTNFDAVYGASKTALNGIFLSLAIDLENTNIKVHLVSPGFTATALNNFQGTDSVEEGSKEPIRVALAEDLPTGSFTGPADFSGEDHILPW
ncbi:MULTISPECIES: SDR family NAD(P)-dependent oxidoreductase [Chryseobacterium]|uniref:NAD(P)-dependent dehydrogenase (Short-subunit alcohol dehydrogenase family) n=1 Tax=Chryseobacterium camelliae TaxID=1265445 RepID=A0ABU0TI78_9FLAO|nr:MULTISPECIES: SDR family NAD(P)-dependent oxidoreductase [Chryseobacterium]MDT3409454.1 NAD(P)-dependent dehydrogenase (short-subunit alcohol dehydrogenase family) [Pseudacidovorax intermedius]MDQ1096681.1 NAD(P)-dependent dehydrogenase (short-subunit alcohol dehydrogenase family) [Chryseobacterium camelliae]MDQ1100625.1 NAD(P)-dependent dehydrogenase (short-subunit alcohol dehydrogenase family) [Chryseobacterium sp. SORGH_AS_1048]MDR6087963.1 NAD(P)-dependent dehydrogenase (short-subunit al